MPGLRIEYYEVSGRTAEEIRASIDRLRPADPNTGVRVDAFTSWYMHWNVPGSPEGVCRTELAVVTVDVTVGLPRLADPGAVRPAVLQRWNRYLAALEAHEANHVRLAYEGRDAVLRAIRASDCANGPQAARAAMEEARRRNDEYDRLTQHGMTEGAHFP
jgi:predicted secreted Zn-dependent protease